MKLLKDRILKDGKVFDGNVLKVDNFLNHQIDVSLMKEIGEEFHRRFEGENVTKIMTIEASGIAVAAFTALAFGVPMVFAKKSKSTNIADSVYLAKVESFTHGRVYDVILSKEFLSNSDRVLIVDDFLARGNALHGLIDIVHQAGATLVGTGAVIEKGFQGGGDELRAAGIRHESLAVIESMAPDGDIVFRD